MSHRNTKLGCASFVLALLAVPLLAGVVCAQTTAFTYQGRLTEGGAPASGSYDLQFTLWDALSGGAQQPQASPATLTKPAVAVTGGVFSVLLDFGVNAFPGADRFLEIGVRPAGSAAAFTLLSPRQQISSTPYAVRTLNAAAADSLSSACIGCVTDAQINSVAASKLTGSIPPSVLPAGGSFIQNSTGLQLNASFNISGDGKAGGTLSAGLQYNLGANRVLSTPGTNNLFVGAGAGAANTVGTGNVFAGAGAGQSNIGGRNNAFYGFNAGLNNRGTVSPLTGNALTGLNNSFFGANAGRANQSGNDNSFFGADAGATGTQGNSNSFFGAHSGSVSTGDANSFFGTSAGGNNAGSRNSFYGVNAGAANTTGSDNTIIGTFANVGSGNLTNATAVGANAFVGQSNSLVLGSINGVNGATADTNVGIGTTIPQTKFQVVTRGGLTPALSVRDTGHVLIGSPLELTCGNHCSTNFTLQVQAGNGDNGVYGESSGIGVDGNGDIGVFGVGRTYAVQGFSVIGTGVYGRTEAITGMGVYGENTSGGYAGFFSGRVRISSIPLLPSAAHVCFNAAGDLLQCGLSSLRFKTNVQPLLGGLNVITRLRPISFNWKEGGQPDIGLGAEDVARVAPAFVFKNDKGEVMGIKYERLDLLLINAVKEQQQQLEQQRHEIAQLAGQVRQLRAAAHRRGARR